MSNEHPFTGTCNYVPDADGAVVASRYQHATSSSQSAYSMIMAFQVKFVVWVFINILLQKAKY